MAKVNTRIQSKHDVEKNWANATFAPLPGEIIIYDKDKGVDGGTHEKPRIKVGDGTTAVGSLPFVVDKEATDAAIAAVEADLQGALKEVSVSGRNVTFKKFDGTEVNITTQDTNSDTKVTNTKNNTVKAYVTGTTNAATTSTQVYDSTIYIDSEEGKLVAKKFQGKAMQDDLGNTISATYETQADATEKLTEAKTYTNTKTTNMNKDAYLTWGGRNLAGQVSPLDASLVTDFGANRFAFYPSSQITLEYSTNGGSTWTVLDDANKKKYLVGGSGSNSKALYIGNSSAVNTDKSNYMCRVTFYTTSCLYTVLNKFAIQVSTNGSTGCYCTIDARRKGKQDANEDTWVTFADQVTVNGWSGWNIINTESITTHGNSETQFSQIRFTFGVEQHASSSEYPGLTIWQIQAYGPNGWWSAPTNMSRNGHVYSYDDSQNVTFPAKVTATKFVGPLQGNATSATSATYDSAGNKIVDTYAPKAALDVVFNPSSLESNYISAGGTAEIYGSSATEPYNMVLEINSEDTYQDLWQINPYGGTAIPIEDPATQMARPLNSFLNSTVSSSSGEDFCEYMPGNTTCVFLDDLRNSGNPFNTIYCYPFPDFPASSGAILQNNASNAGNNTYYLLGIFYSAMAEQLYIVSFGSFFEEANLDARLSYAINGNKLYIDSSTLSNVSYANGGKHVYDVPEDLKFMTVGFDANSDFLTGCSPLYVSNAELSSVQCFSDLFESSISLYKPGTYMLPTIGGTPLASNPLVAITSPVNASFTLHYLKPNTGFSKAVKHIKECNTKNFEEELNKLISSGRSDPTSDTPGVLYFKYL